MKDCLDPVWLSREGIVLIVLNGAARPSLKVDSTMPRFGALEGLTVEKAG